MIDKIKEAVTLRGICESIQKMAMPGFKNLADLLDLYGWKLIKKD